MRLKSVCNKKYFALVRSGALIPCGKFRLLFIEHMKALEASRGASYTISFDNERKICLKNSVQEQELCYLWQLHFKGLPNRVFRNVVFRLVSDFSDFNKQFLENLGAVNT